MVSVIIPVYNGEKYIDKCLTSLEKETKMLDLEIIIVNDCSTDNSLSLLRKYDFIKIIENEKNMGPSYSRNRGIEVAIGEYITLLDIDDYYTPKRLSDLYSFCKKNDCVICSDLNLNITESGKVKSLYPNFVNPFFSYKELTLGEFVNIDCGPLKPFIKRKFLIENHLLYNENIKYSEDFDFYYRIVMRCNIFYLINQHSNIRLIHHDSLSQNRFDLYRQSLKQTINLISDKDEVKNKFLVLRIKKLSKLFFNEIKSKRCSRNIFLDFVKLYNLLLFKMQIVK